MKITSLILGCVGLVLTAAFLELGKHTAGGWIAAAFVFALFFTAVFLIPKGARGLYWLGIALCLAGTVLSLVLSRPPVRPVPAVSVRDPEVTDVVTVREGRLTGVVNGEGTVEVFAGIPYARPPVGDLRWREPQDPEPWEGVRACDTFAPMSMQTRGSTVFASLTQIVAFRNYRVFADDNWLEPMSEDSLYLNVWRPKGVGEGDRVPVLVYIHGGSLTGGHPSHEQYNGERMAEQGILVVNLAYRLNVFGYFAHEDLAAESPNGTTGNYGLLDQIRALRWIHDNIAAFGGDPDQVTVCGESAGASSVNALCASPLAEGLFRRAIAESSGITARIPYHTFRSLERAKEMGEAIVKEFGGTRAQDLRSVPAEKLVATRYTNDSMTVDGYALREMPYLTYEKGENHEEALLSGFNVHEADLFSLMVKVDSANYEERLRPLLGSYAADAVKLFPPAERDPGYRYFIDAGGDAKGSYDRVLSAVWFSYSHFNWSRYMAAQGRPVWEYWFTKDNPGLGSSHAGELRYVFGNLDHDAALYDEKDEAVSRAMMAAWVSFVKTGDPNGEGLEVPWPGFAEAPDMVYEFGEHTGPVRDPYLELYALIDRALLERSEEETK